MFQLFVVLYEYNDLQSIASKALADYKFRAQNAKQDVAKRRLEPHVIWYKTAVNFSEQSKEVLKTEKRKLERELAKLLIQWSVMEY